MEKLPSQPSRWWDWPAIGLHVALLETVAARLSATTWTPHLHLIEAFTSIGFVIGTALGYSRFHRRIASWLTFFYMLVMLPLQWTLVIAKEVSLEEKLASVAGRLYYAISAFVERRPVDDPLFFVAIMSIAFWIISSWAGFTLVRNQNYLGAVLPSAIGLLIIQGYDNVRPGRMWFLALFTFLALLLLGRLQFLKNRASWRARHIFLSPDNSFDLTTSMTVMAGLLIFVAWMAPASMSGLNSAIKVWDQMTRPWHEFTQRMENAVSALQSPNRGRPTEFYGTELRLGLGFPNSPTVIFTARTPNLPPGEEPPRYYWRGRVYDQFLESEWQATGTNKEDFLPTTEQPPASVSEEAPARFAFQIGEGKMSLLYGPSEPIWISRPGTRVVSLPVEGQEKEVLSWVAAPALLPGEIYQVDAIIKNPTTQQLREAGTEYPEWATNKYLQLPEDFSPRIAALAKEITINANTPYDKTMAITNYLRKTLKYVKKIQSPPRDKDALEWMLFEYKQAYCVYYATSEVLMLRSLGIPARMAVGFTQGSTMTVDVGPQQQPRVIDGTYVVMRNNAHAWPEVYFPGIGWVEFEPTAGEAPLDRPQPVVASENAGGPAPDLRAEENQDLASEEPDAGATDEPVPQTAPLALYYLLPLLVVGAALMIFLNRRYSFQARVPVFLRSTLERSGIEVPVWVIRWEKWVRLSLIEKSFESINFALRQLDKPVPVHATPSERAAKLTSLLPEKADQIKVLLDEHQTSLYTSRIGNATQARRAAFEIRKQAINERIRRFFFGKSLT